MDWKLLGLNKYEAAVYDAVVQLGRGTAAKITKISKVPYGRIYDVLESLIEKNMLRTIPGMPKVYVIADPAIIEREIKKREAEFEKAKKEISKLKHIYESTPEEAIQVATGKRAWFEIVRELGVPKSKFNYKIKYNSDYHPEWVRNQIVEIKRGIDSRQLVRYDDETKNNLKKWSRHIKKIKKYNNEGVALGVTEDYVLFALIKSNAVVVIRDKPFIHLMKNLFEDAYKNAEEIK